MKDFLIELLSPFCHDRSIKNPIPLFEKWGFHDLAIFAPPRIEGKKSVCKLPDLRFFV